MAKGPPKNKNPGAFFKRAVKERARWAFPLFNLAFFAHKKDRVFGGP
jgi:hypothetical protein